MSLRSHCHSLADANINGRNVSSTMTIVDFNNHLYEFTRNETIFGKGHLRSCIAFTYATTAGDLSLRFSLLRGDHSCLSENNLSSSLDLELGSHRFDRSSHMIDNDSFLFGGNVLEASWPAFKSLEAKGERVLSWGETTAVIDHHLVSSKHVSGLEILHSEVTVSRCANVLGTIIIICVLLGLAIRNVEVLNRLCCTSDSCSSWGGMAAMGSNWGGGGGCPG